MPFYHTCSSRGKSVCLRALNWVDNSITIIGTTMVKSFCNKHKSFYKGKIFSEFQISSTVGEMKDTTQPFHPTGWNCTWSPRPIPSPSISAACLYFIHWNHDFLTFEHLEQAATQRTANRKHNHNSHNPKQPSWDALNLLQLCKTMAKPPLIAVGAGFSSFWAN